VKFLKAYYHFYLMHLYGPIPIIRTNADMNASPDELRVFREPVEEVTEYIVDLLEEAEGHLKEVDSDLYLQFFSWQYGGRITTSIAKAVKAKVLVWAASKLFNGNDFYHGFTDSRGKQLIPDGEPDPAKWTRAATACKEAIDWVTTEGGHALNTSAGSHGDVSDATRLKYVLRYAVTEPFNPEIIWPSTHPTAGFSGWGGSGSSNLWQMNLARESMPSFYSVASGSHTGSMGTTLNMVELFYTSNGLPIDEDDDWQRYVGGYEARYDTRQATADDEYHRYYIGQGVTTAQLNFLREPRFYAYVGFDGGIWEGVGRPEANSFVVNKNTTTMIENVATGYYMKKVVHPASVFTPAGSTYNIESIPYSFPYLRLADLYLLYAEALNEAEGPSATVYEYIDRVRTRAGLKGVAATWTQAASMNKTKHTTQDGLRQIIRRERAVELCFEGKRGEDMRRWREAHNEFNSPIRGWNGITPSSTVSRPADLTNSVYYLVTNHHERTVNYSVRDYLWPIKADDINVNNNLVQNPGW
jgi:hypothetical protein